MRTFGEAKGGHKRQSRLCGFVLAGGFDRLNHRAPDQARISSEFQASESITYGQPQKRPRVLRSKISATLEQSSKVRIFMIFAVIVLFAVGYPVW